jgi:hypothetical protein
MSAGLAGHVQQARVPGVGAGAAPIMPAPLIHKPSAAAPGGSMASPPRGLPRGSLLDLSV